MTQLPLPVHGPPTGTAQTLTQKTLTSTGSFELSTNWDVVAEIMCESDWYGATLCLA